MGETGNILLDAKRCLCSYVLLFFGGGLDYSAYPRLPQRIRGRGSVTNLFDSSLN
jgi:hypothetical protein